MNSLTASSHTCNTHTNKQPPPPLHPHSLWVGEEGGGAAGECQGPHGGGVTEFASSANSGPAPRSRPPCTLRVTAPPPTLNPSPTTTPPRPPSPPLLAIQQKKHDEAKVKEEGGRGGGHLHYNCSLSEGGTMRRPPRPKPRVTPPPPTPTMSRQGRLERLLFQETWRRRSLLKAAK